MNIKTQLDNLKKLNLPTDQFVVVSSGVLAIRGIRDAKDIDVVVTDSLWNEMITHTQVILNSWRIPTLQLENDIEILDPAKSIFGNSKVVPVKEIFEKADVFDGVKFINLYHLKKIKLEMGREIDLKDIELIDTYIHNHVQK